MSSASASTSTTTLTEQRPEADPLPRKVGERGYVAPPKSPKTPDATQEVPLTPSLPARHPADRDNSTANPSSTDAPAQTASNNSSTNNSTTSNTKKSWGKRLTFLGISLFSWFRVVILLIFLAGTSAAWGITIEVFGRTGTSGDSQDQNAQVNFDSPNSSNDGEKPGDLQTSFSSIIIVHVSFTIVVLVELLFLERSIFHARAERYLHKRGMQSGEGGANMGFAPWSRPSLPTYATALAETGVRTGDVEDNMIAIPPPPAYGNTRGSVLLLSGFLRDSLIRNMNRSSQRSSQRSTSNQVRVASPREMEEGRGSRPISYDASEELDNARRAAQLEEALSILENGGHTLRP